MSNFWLHTRSQESEELDSLKLSEEVLQKVLSQLGFLNRILGNHRVILNSIKELLQRFPDLATRPIQIIDLASGGGDVSLALSSQLTQYGIKHQITGIDFNEESIAFAEQHQEEGSSVNFVQADIMAVDFTLPPCDLLISSQFIYHFKDDQLSEFLNRIKKQVKYAVIFSELKRSWLAHSIFGLSRFTPLHRIIRMDGQKAIRRTFSRADWNSILKKVNNVTYSIDSKFPFRYKIQIENIT